MTQVVRILMNDSDYSNDVEDDQNMNSTDDDNDDTVHLIMIKY